MRKFLVAAALTAAMTGLPAAARADIVVDTSLGKGYQAAPTPRQWEQLNLEIAPGYRPTLPVLSWFRFQLGIVTDFADKSGSSTNLELRPMVSVVPPIFPLYGRVIFAVNNLFERNGSKREYAYGAALGAKIGLPPLPFIPELGVFAEAGLIPRERDFKSVDPTTLVVTTNSKFAWVVEGRVGAYLIF